VGAGFGRLTDEYQGYGQVVVLDYSLSQLQYAQAHYGRSDRYVYVAADAYNLPFRAGVFDGASMIRVIHHMRDPNAILAGVRRVLAPQATFILEHANKRNLKAILRHAAGQQDWNPYTLAQHEFVELNIDFHPKDMLNKLRANDFATVRRLPVSFFRLGLLKRTVPTDVLAGLDGVLQHSTLFITPSIFIQNVAIGDTPDATTIDNANPDALFVAPQTHNRLKRDGDTLLDTVSGERWAIRDGIYDFKAPIA
jgi:SAM-dependent methyltransferase